MNRISLVIYLSMLIFIQLNGQILLEADGPGNTYELINSIFAPTGGDVVETPDCAHSVFGRHIKEVFDTALNKNAFEFHIHVSPDNDRCINFDRQRLEIKTYDQSPDNMKITPGETVIYKWKFKLPTGFKVSSSFTHLHQIKPVGGDESTPTFALTARKGSPNKLELTYYQTTDIGAQKLTSVNLSLLEGRWVEVTERFTAAVTGGVFAIEIKNISTGAVIMTYQNNNISTYRPDNQFLRPKWGIYRSLNSPLDLRDEIVLFADFSIQELNTTTIQSVTKEEKGFSLIPNPAKHTTVLKIFADHDGYKDIYITSLCGKIQFTKNIFLHQGQNQYNLNLKHFEAGTYLVYVDQEIKGQSLILLK